MFGLLEQNPDALVSVINHIVTSDISNKPVKLWESAKKTTEVSEGVDVEKDVEVTSLGSGDDATIRIRFCFHPELIFEDDKKKFIFREGNTRGFGCIIGATDAVYEPVDNKAVTKYYKRTKGAKKERRAIRVQQKEDNPAIS